MKKNYLDDSNSTAKCPLRYLQEILGGKWKMPIICMLSSGTPLRNSTIKRRLGNITNATLSQTLKELEASGIVHREQFNEVPPHVEYTLTERGMTVVSALSEIGAWAINDMNSTGTSTACEQCVATC